MIARWPFPVALAVAVYLTCSYVFMWPPVVMQVRIRHGYGYECQDRLREIQDAKERWAVEYGKPDGTPVDIKEVNRYLHGGRVPVCPEGGTYSYNPVGAAPTCSLQGTPRKRVRVGSFHWAWSGSKHHEVWPEYESTIWDVICRYACRDGWWGLVILSGFLGVYVLCLWRILKRDTDRVLQGVVIDLFLLAAYILHGVWLETANIFNGGGCGFYPPLLAVTVSLRLRLLLVLFCCLVALVAVAILTRPRKMRVKDPGCLPGAVTALLGAVILNLMEVGTLLGMGSGAQIAAIHSLEDQVHRLKREELLVARRQDLASLVADAEHVLVATVTRVDMIDGKGRRFDNATAMTWRGNENQLRLHVSVATNGIIATSADRVPENLTIPLWQESFDTVGSRRQAVEGKTFIFLLKGADFRAVHAGLFMRDPSERSDIESILKKRKAEQRAILNAAGDVEPP